MGPAWIPASNPGMSGPSTSLADELILNPGSAFAERVIPETLRTEVLDPAALHDWCDQLRSRRDCLTGDSLRDSLRQTGTAAGMLGDLATAHRELTQALELTGNAEPARTLARVRLAEVHRQAGRLDLAAEMFDAAERAADGFSPQAAAVIHQHAGKFAFDAGDYPRALAAFEIALWLRRGIEDPSPELIASSELAVRVARERLARR